MNLSNEFVSPLTVLGLCVAPYGAHLPCNAYPSAVSTPGSAKTCRGPRLPRWATFCRPYGAWTTKAKRNTQEQRCRPEGRRDSSDAAGGSMHILLVLAILVLVIKLIQGRTYLIEGNANHETDQLGGDLVGRSGSTGPRLSRH